MAAVAREWWTSRKTFGRGYAVLNVLVGAACLALALLDIRLGLGTYGRWLLALPFGLVPLVWGIVVLRAGHRPEVARPLRLAGDISLWSLTALFTVLALLLDPAETGPLVTLVAITLVTVIGAIVNARRAR
jgi:hypothetical protein